MPPLRLQGTDIGRLSTMLRAAFSRARFAELLLTRLNRNVGDYAAPGDTDPSAFLNVLVEANAQLWLRDLLREARNALPTDPNLQEFADEFGLAPPMMAVDQQGKITRVSGNALQLQIQSAQSTYNILTWRKKLGAIEGRVCRVEYPEKKGQGTGFLVAADLVMTNYHVVEPMIKNPALASQIVLRFDYKVLDDEVTVNAGKTYKLAADWLAHSSKYSQHDFEVTPSAEPAPDELDYALLRVDGAPGNDPVGGDTNDPKAVPRRWIAVTETAHDFVANPAIYIVQHPDAKPMQIAIDANAVVGVAANGTRVRYTTTTEPGSSGSPCFSADWELVALHHSGDPKYTQGLKPEFNRGVPTAAIWQWLTAQGQAQLLGAAV